MRGWQALPLGLALGALGLATRNAALVTCAAAFALLLAIGLWHRALLSGRIAGTRTLAVSVIPWGGALAESVTLSNASRLGVPAARVVDRATLPAHPSGYVAALPGKRSLTWDVTVPCRTRGRYTVGPIEVTTADPLALFPATRVVERGASVLVLPRWVLLGRSALPLDGTLPGDLRGRRSAEAPPEVAGVRGYQPGDAPARIHWAASARAGALLTKQFEPEAQTTLWLALDLDTSEVAGGALTADAEELLVTAACSLGMYALQRAHIAVAVLASGTAPASLLPERGRGQEKALQELLAEVRAGDAVRLTEHVAGHERHLGAGHVLVLLTARGPGHWAPWLDRLARRGVAARVVRVTSDAGAATHEVWEVPTLTLPVDLADPARHVELVARLEEGAAE